MKGERKLGRSGIVNALMSPEISILIPLVVLCTYTGINKPAFLSTKNLQIIVRYCAFIGALALGQAFVLMTGEIDLSIGTNSMMCSIVFTYLAITLQWAPWLSITCGILAGALVGWVNSLFSFRLKLSSWIVTLSTQYICKGLATVISRGAVIHSLEGGFATFSAARPLGMTWMLWIVFALFVLAEIATRFTPMGRIVHAVGISSEASRIAGINVGRIKTLCMVFAGTMAGVCGILQSVSTLSGSPATGIGNEFPAIICCAIGGVSTNGGKGTMLGVMIGVLMYQTLKNCLQLLGMDNNYQLVFTGIILVLAVCFDIMKTNLRSKSLK